MADEAPAANADGTTADNGQAPNPEAKAADTPPANIDIKLGEGEGTEGNAPAATVENNADGTVDTVAYEPTGDTALDVCLGFLGGLGIAPENPAMAAAMKGDFSLLEAALATMGDKAQGWQQMLALGKQAYERQDNAAKTAAKAVSDAVISVAGDAKTWGEVRTWAMANADQAEKDAINAMFDAGPIQARAAAKMLMEAYSTATGTVVTPADPLTNLATSGGQQTSNGPLSPRDYSNEVTKLYQKLGHKMDGSSEYKALQARRAAYRG